VFADTFKEVVLDFSSSVTTEAVLASYIENVSDDFVCDVQLAFEEVVS